MSNTMIATATRIRHKLDKEVSVMLKKHQPKTSLPAKKAYTYAGFLENKMAIISVIREGIPYSFFNLIQSIAPFTEIDWANILDMSAKSLQRYKQGAKKFKPLHSEKIIEMAEVTHIGLDVFGDQEKFRRWLDTPSFALGNLKPMELLRDSYGKDLVVGEMTRINYGILV